MYRRWNMIKTESTNMQVYNPYSDEYTSIYAEIRLHYDGYKLDGIEITKLLTDDGVDLYDWLNPKYIEDLEAAEFEHQLRMAV